MISATSGGAGESYLELGLKLFIFRTRSSSGSHFASIVLMDSRNHFSLLILSGIIRVSARFGPPFNQRGINPRRTQQGSFFESDVLPNCSIRAENFPALTMASIPLSGRLPWAALPKTSTLIQANPLWAIQTFRLVGSQRMAASAGFP